MHQVDSTRLTRDLDRDADFETVSALLATATTEPDQLLPVLHAIQAQVGHISKGAMRLVAQAFNVSRADVYGVVSFYHDFREEPVGQHVVQICMAEACQAVGCRALSAHAERSLGVALGETTADGRIHLEATYCLGNCALGPSVRVDQLVIGRVSPTRFDGLMSALPTGSVST